MALWLTTLEAEDGSWADEPLPTDGLRDDAISNARAMWPKVPLGHRIALYRCEFIDEVEIAEPTP